MTNKTLVHITGKITINKRVDFVFAFFANPANDHLWRTEINESRLNGPLQQGVTVSEYSYLSKKAANNLIELTCIAFEQGEMAVFETQPDAPFYLKSQRTTTAISSDVTEVMYTLHFDTAIVKHALGISLPKFIVTLKAKADMKKYLKALKKQLEATVG